MRYYDDDDDNGEIPKTGASEIFTSRLELYTKRREKGGFIMMGMFYETNGNEGEEKRKREKIARELRVVVV